MTENELIIKIINLFSSKPGTHTGWVEVYLHLFLISRWMHRGGQFHGPGNFILRYINAICLSRLIPYTDIITGDHQCGFRGNRSTTDHIFCIRQTLEKKWEYNKAVHQLFIDW